MRIAPAIALSSDRQTTLEQWARSRSLPVRIVERARMVRLAAEGRQDKEIAATMKMTPRARGGHPSSPLAWCGES